VPATTFQDDLFGRARWLERTSHSGVTFRIQVEPVGPGTVRLLRYERRRPGERDFVRRPAEEGRVVPLATLAPEQDWAALFGSVAEAGR